MNTPRALFSRILGQFHRSDPRLDEELSLHLDLLAAENERNGMPSDAARDAARRSLGSLTQIREAHREQRRLPLLDSLFQDLRYTFRQWLAHPVFTAAAILTLSLAIGANSAIFQLLDRIAVRPLPVRDAHDLVVVQGYWSGREQGFSYPLLREMNARQNVVEGIFATGGANIRDVQIDGRSLAEPPRGLFATGNYFRLIGTEPQIGRFFTESDDMPGALPIAVLSDRFWREELGARASAIGSAIRINNIPVTVAGVARPEFFGERIGSEPAIWLPVNTASVFSSNSVLTASTIWLTPMARLRPGVSAAQAQAQLSVLWDRLRDFSIRTRESIVYTLALLPGSRGLDILQTQFTRPLWILMGIAGLVALIACCNLANLLLARATARTHEIGVRLALGAGRSRMLRQLLTESIALAAAGVVLGVALASAASRQLVKLASAGENWQISTALDWRIAGFTLLVTFVSVLIFGLAPAFAATRNGLNAALHSGLRTHTSGPWAQGATRSFAIAQVTLSLLLAAGASLLVHSFWKLMHQEFGYQTESVLMVALNNNGAPFMDFLGGPQNLAIARQAREIPGVRDAAMAGAGLLNSHVSILPGRVSLPDGNAAESNLVRLVPVTPHYLETMGIGIVRGRALTDDDAPGAPRVAVISETAARQLFGTANPIGRKFSSGDAYQPAQAFEVVGVMRDVRYASPREPFGGLAFAPFGQMPLSTPPTLVLRMIGDTGSVIAALQQRLPTIAPKVKLARIELVHDLVQTQARRERLLAWLSGVFGALSVLLAGIGLYGVISFSAECRMQEMGIRLALGARPPQIRKLLLKETAHLLVFGMALGGAATLVLGRTLQSLLFDLNPQDPSTIAFAVLLLSAVAFGAGYIPALRASRLDPLTALRAE